MIFGAVKFQVDVKEGEGEVEGVWTKPPVDVKRWKSEYVDWPVMANFNLGFGLKLNLVFN